jgi:hypothetical protein
VLMLSLGYVCDGKACKAQSKRRNESISEKKKVKGRKESTNGKTQVGKLG